MNKDEFISGRREVGSKGEIDPFVYEGVLPVVGLKDLIDMFNFLLLKLQKNGIIENAEDFVIECQKAVETKGGLTGEIKVKEYNFME